MSRHWVVMYGRCRCCRVAAAKSGPDKLVQPRFAETDLVECMFQRGWEECLREGGTTTIDILGAGVLRKWQFYPYNAAVSPVQSGPSRTTDETKVLVDTGQKRVLQQPPSQPQLQRA